MILRPGQELQTMSLEHFVVSISEEVLKKKKADKDGDMSNEHRNH